jgi:hypothetical protein
MEFSEASRMLTKELSKMDKKREGIYFTPPATVAYCVSRAKQFLLPDTSRILEPSCGSGEFLRPLVDAFPGSAIDAVEMNTTIFERVDDTFGDSVRMYNADYLAFGQYGDAGDMTDDGLYDLIIGNPPYFVMKREDVPTEYLGYLDGRPNIFVLFVIKALKSLAVGGIMCFVLPRSFLNCLYYDRARAWICRGFEILDLVERQDKYLETEQPTVVMIVRRPTDDHDWGQDNNRFVVPVPGKLTVFNTVEKVEVLTDLMAGATTLGAQGFVATIGRVVWNQVKSSLTDDPAHTRLIYSSDIDELRLGMKTYKNPAKKNYISTVVGKNDPMIALNRGYGVGKYSFEYCLVDVDYDYIAENHVVQLMYVGMGLTRADKVKLYERIIASFGDPRTTQFITHYFGNSAINARELIDVVPLYW